MHEDIRRSVEGNRRPLWRNEKESRAFGACRVAVMSPTAGCTLATIKKSTTGINTNNKKSITVGFDGHSFVLIRFREKDGNYTASISNSRSTCRKTLASFTSADWLGYEGRRNSKRHWRHLEWVFGTDEPRGKSPSRFYMQKIHLNLSHWKASGIHSEVEGAGSPWRAKRSSGCWILKNIRSVEEQSNQRRTPTNTKRKRAIIDLKNDRIGALHSSTNYYLTTEGTPTSTAPFLRDSGWSFAVRGTIPPIRSYSRSALNEISKGVFNKSAKVVLGEDVAA